MHIKVVRGDPEIFTDFRSSTVCYFCIFKLGECQSGVKIDKMEFPYDNDSSEHGESGLEIFLLAFFQIGVGIGH